MRTICFALAAILISPEVARPLPSAAGAYEIGQDERDDDPRLGPEAERRADRIRGLVREETAALHEHPWAGEYVWSSGFGATTLSLAPDAGFAYEISGCLGVMDRNFGTVAEKDGILTLAPEYELMNEHPPLLREPIRLIRWGGRRYLVAESRVVDFCNGINSGVGPYALLHEDDADLEIEGKPDLPEEFAAYLLDEPIEARILAADQVRNVEGRYLDYRTQTVTIDAGVGSGLLVGMELYTDPWDLEVIRVTEVGDSTAAGVCRLLTDSSEPLREGAILSTRWRPARRLVAEPRGAGDLFATSIAALGDVNGDGVDDFAVSDPHRGDRRARQGWIAVISGKTRNLLWERWGEQESERIGEALFALGDVDGDGVPDLAEQPWNAGHVTVLSGATGAAIRSFPARSVASAGDVDGDGLDDLLVAHRRRLHDPARAPRPFVLGSVRSGASDEVLKTLSVSSTNIWPGGAVAVGDVDGDGLPDWGIRTRNDRLLLFGAANAEPMELAPESRLLAIGLPLPPSRSRRPAAAIWRAGDGLEITFFEDAPGGGLALDRVRESARIEWAPDEAPPPMHLESVGDADGDGVADFLVGVDGYPLPELVRAGVWSGSRGTPLWEYVVPRDAPIHSTRMVAIGDQDADGVRDVLVGGSTSPGGPEVTGWVEVRSGKTGARIFALTSEDLRDR